MQNVEKRFGANKCNYLNVGQCSGYCLLYS